MDKNVLFLTNDILLINSFFITICFRVQISYMEWINNQCCLSQQQYDVLSLMHWENSEIYLQQIFHFAACTQLKFSGFISFSMFFAVAFVDCFFYFFFLLFFFFKNTTDQTDLRCLLTVQIPGPLSGILSYNIRIPGDGIGWEF